MENTLSPFLTRPEDAALSNWRAAPYNTWSFSNVREVLPTARIAASRTPVALSQNLRNFDEFSISRPQGELDFAGYCKATHTDNLVVLHEGKIVHEFYADPALVNHQHILMSVSKSILGLIAGILTDRGIIDINRTVESYLPALADTAYTGATLRDLLDMRAGVWFIEDYTALDGLIIDYRKAQGWNPYEVGETPSDLRSFYRLMTRKNGPHADRFLYVSPNTDLLGLIFEAASGKTYASLVSELLWAPMGAKNDAYISLDRFGAPRSAGGFCATARDLALVGQTILNNGRNGQTQVIPTAWLEDIWTADTQKAWNEGDFASYYPDRTMHYRSKWYGSTRKENMIFGLGVNGQNIFIDRDRNLVIVKLSSHGDAMDMDLIALTMTGIDELRRCFD